MKTAEGLTWAAERLRAAGVPEAARDSALLLAEALGVAPWQVYATAHDDLIGPEQEIRFITLLKRRERREPMAYILGRREFMTTWLKCDRRSLIPRPETEILAEEAVRLGREIGRGRMLDLGTGSGCIAIAFALLAGEAWSVTASDVSVDALSLAAENAALHSVAGRVRMVVSDLFEGIEGHAPFDLVVSNPPYVPSEEIGGLPPDVANYEPLAALDGGPGGLELIGAVIGEAPRFLRPGGWLLLEIGYGQAERVKEMFLSHGDYDGESFRSMRDLTGIPRAIRCRVRSS